MIDMCIGNPDFMMPYWDRHDTSDYDAWVTWGMNPEDEMGYLKEGGTPELISEIRRIHQRVGNCSLSVADRIVVGNGATQLLFAALSLSQRDSGIFIQAPYWFRLPDMIKMAGHRTYNDVDYGSGYEYAIQEIVTAPNNPTGRTLAPKVKSAIYDCCYNWPQYGRMQRFDAEIQIYSLAKATGHAGSRIGWAVVRDPVKAAAMTKFVEYTTGGVSREAQSRAVDTLGTQFSGRGMTVFTWGQKVLARRWTALLAVPVRFRVLNGNGMFAWCDGEIPPGVEAFDGVKCGGHPGTFRLNMGVSEETWKAFMKVIS